LLASVATEQSEGARRSVARVLGVLGALEPRKYRDGVARGAGDRSSPRRRLADASPPPASDTIGGGLGSAGGMTRGEALTAEALAAQAIVGGGGLVVATAAAAGGGGGGGGIADRFALDSHPPGSSVYLAGFALLQLLSILHDNALATAPPPRRRRDMSLSLLGALPRRRSPPATTASSPPSSTSSPRSGSSARPSCQRRSRANLG